MKNKKVKSKNRKTVLLLLLFFFILSESLNMDRVRRKKKLEPPKEGENWQRYDEMLVVVFVN